MNSTVNNTKHQICQKFKFGGCLIAAALPLLLATSATAQSKITFDDILSDPNNTELNLAYAKQEADVGNLLKAIAALERLLIDEPNADDVRLYYVTLLNQIGDFTAAQNEINDLKQRPLSPEIRQQVSRYDRSGVRTKKASRLYASLGLGFTYDDNVSGLTDEASVLADKEGDYGITGRAQAKYVRDLPGDTNTRFVATGRFFAKGYQDFDIVSFTFATLSAGFEGEDGPYKWKATARGRNLNIGGDNYVTEIGPYFQIGRKSGEKTTLEFTGYYYNQEYENITIGVRPTLFEDQRSGYRFESTLRLKHKFTPNLRGTIGLGYQNKNAEYEPYDYDGLVAYIAGRKYFANGAYINFDHTYRDIEYAALDGRVVSTILNTGTREDERYYTRIATGIPLTSLLSGINLANVPVLNETQIEFAVFNDNRKSNFSIYEFENTGIELQFAWRFSR